MDSSTGVGVFEGGSVSIGVGVRGTGSLMTNFGFIGTGWSSFSSSSIRFASCGGELDASASVLPLLECQVGFVGVSDLRLTLPWRSLIVPNVACTFERPTWLSTFSVARHSFTSSIRSCLAFTLALSSFAFVQDSFVFGVGSGLASPS